MTEQLYSCPHCGKATFSSWDKALATSSRPAKCEACGGLSYVSIWSNLSLGLLFEALMLAVVLIGISGHIFAALAVLSGGLIVGLWLDKRQPLRATDKAGVARAKRSFLVVAFFLLAALMVFQQFQ